MTTFVNISYNTQHRGVARFERAFALVQHITQRLQQESTYAVLLGFFGVMSLIAAVYDVVDVSPEGQELGAWVVLWTAALALMVVFAKFCKRQLARWMVVEREARMWDNAMTDYRIMAELLSAKSRQQ